MRSLASIVSIASLVGGLCAACDDSERGGGASSESTVCDTVGTTWWNKSFPVQTGLFHVELSATPSRDHIDAVVGVSNGSATTWTNLAAIVRFNPDGWIDARNGSTYTASVSPTYRAGQTFWIKIEVDFYHHTYSAWASEEQGKYGSSNQIATNFAFRTEQASVTKLSNVAAYVNTTTPGSLQVCGLVVSALQAGSCTASSAGRGFVNVAVEPAVHGMVVTADATPSAIEDGVIGIASGAVDDYNDFAASIRFYTNGWIEVRDGDSYVSGIQYVAGHKYSFKFLIDLENKTYFVVAYDLNGSSAPQWLGSNHHFRTQQVGVTQLDHVATIVASSSGRVDLCDPRSASPDNLRYAKGGALRLAPTADGVIEWGLQTGDNETQKWDVNGKFLGSPGFAIGGEPAVDDTGNLYLSYLWGSDLVVDAYSPTFAHRWSSRLPVGGGTLLGTAVSNGFLLVILRLQNRMQIWEVSTVSGSGFVESDMYGTAWVLGVGRAGWATAAPEYRLDGSIFGWEFWSHAADGTERFFKTFEGSFNVTAVAISADGGIVFGGAFSGQTINFGDRTLEAIPNGTDAPLNAYFVSLTPSGALRYSWQTGGDSIADLDADANYIAVSSHRFTKGLPWVEWGVYDMAANRIAGCYECDVGLGHQGNAKDIWLANHRVYLNVDEYMWWGAPPNGDGLTTHGFMLAWDF